MTQDDPTETILPMMAERHSVETRRIVTGRVRVRVETLTEAVPVSADLQGERVEVTRVPVDREVTERPDIRIEGDVTIVPVLEEVLVVETRLVLREEIHLRRLHETVRVTDAVDLRSQRATVERDGETDPPTPNQQG